LEQIKAPDDFFGAIKQDYRTYYEQGYFYKVDQPALYIYRIEQTERQYTGLIAGVDIKDFLDGNIRKHEHTLAAKEEKQMLLLRKRRAAVKPVMLAYATVEIIDQWLLAYTEQFDAVLDIPFGKDESHKVWAIESPTLIEELQQLFRVHVPAAYIADGHHRTSTAARMYQKMKDGEIKGDFNNLFAAFFPNRYVEIRDFNRVVTSLNGHTATIFIAKLSQVFEIEVLPKPSRPERKFELTMYLQGEWYRLRWKERIMLEYADETVILDAMLLDHKVMAKVLGIEDVRNDSRVRYVEGPKGIDGLLKQAEKYEDSVAFCLYPVQMEEVMAVADIGQVLPPKSTWFEPRMKNGVLVQEY
jgi:uncharacterized protein (DUF1015 family)